MEKRCSNLTCPLYCECYVEALIDEFRAKVLEIVDKAMKVNQKLKEAYIEHGQSTGKADYEITLWTEIRRRFEETI